MQTAKLNSKVVINGATYIVAAIYPFLKKAVVVEGNIETGKVFEFAFPVADPWEFDGTLEVSADQALTEKTWSSVAIQNKPGYCIDNFHAGKEGKVKAIDSTNYPCNVNVRIASNGVVFAK